jgi:hypothetical protein
MGRSAYRGSAFGEKGKGHTPKADAFVIGLGPGGVAEASTSVSLILPPRGRQTEVTLRPTEDGSTDGNPKKISDKRSLVSASHQKERKNSSSLHNELTQHKTL